ncbi:FXDC2-like protein [Mya arenaria]|uniref:FXDC2-like protein n=1 Tax=Mya arenaria TaxID=6604 RepID=A0ABY7EE01_MYAAR|nr:FXDC2-like protein [Mya arenaria]
MPRQASADLRKMTFSECSLTSSSEASPGSEEVTSPDEEVKVPKSGWNVKDMVSKGVFMVSVFFLATAVRGEWLLFIVYLGRDHLQSLLGHAEAGNSTDVTSAGMLERLGLRDLHIYVPFALFVSFSLYWGIGLTFDMYFYKNRKHMADTWKCQPDRWLTRSNEWHEFLLGSFNMMLGSVVSGIISCYIMNGGRCTLYMDPGQYGWAYLLLSIPVLFMYGEAVSYYPHRLFHYPWLYKNVHKIHHRYGSPTLYSAVAMHPLEFLMYYVYTLVISAPKAPLVFVGHLLYGYYYGMMDHSGIKMDAVWPWQPSSMFHDDHHRHFHCNFGFNTLLFDRLHGTLRRQNRKYGEKVFGGHGRQEVGTGSEAPFHEYSTSNLIPFT